jgi:AraC-like DNA-binding protein
VRANGALFCRSIMTPPWAVRFENTASLSLYTMLRGEAWLLVDDPVRLHAGDIAVVRHPAPHVVADDPATTPQLRVHSADSFTDAGGHRWLSPRTCGENADGPVQLLTGAYEVVGHVGERLLRALPEVLVVPADAGPGPLLDLVAAELADERPGQQVVLDRSLDWLLVGTLRAWFAQPGASPPAWYRALADPVVGTALRLIHDAPARAWTVAALAEGAGVSRAALARRFTTLVGEPPLTYLTSWRMTLAADLLRAPGATIASVARRVGYTDSFAFSSAFKRVRGVRPSTHRAS